MYVFAEPVTEERADEIQNTGTQYAKDWARRVVGVGKNDPETQEAWQDLQEEVDEQVTEDGTANKDVKVTETSEEVEASAESEAAIEDEITTESETAAESETSTEEAETDDSTIAPPKSQKDTTTSGPLIGWTLTVRNKVNGHYLKRPIKLEPEDNWQIEYHVNEIDEKNVWDLYNATKERRRQLIGLNDDEINKGLANYRKIIQRYASRGRTWRAKQDQINEARGVQIFKPLGPGSEEYAVRSGVAEAVSAEAVSQDKP